MVDAAHSGTELPDDGRAATRYNWLRGRLAHHFRRGVMATARGGKVAWGQVSVGGIVQTVFAALLLWMLAGIGGTIKDSFTEFVTTAHADHQSVLQIQGAITSLGMRFGHVEQAVVGSASNVEDVRKRQTIYEARQTEAEHRLNCDEGVVPRNDCRRPGSGR